MQNAKDTFYEVMRDRLASANPERTIAVRGVTRPAVVVDENETTNVGAQAECFHLRWTEAAVTYEGVLPLVTLGCEISYATAGSPWNGGLDRGRVLAAMDAELLTATGTCPRNAVKKSFTTTAQGGSAVALQSRIWWSDLRLGPVKVDGGQVGRTANVEVMCFEDAGELG